MWLMKYKCECIKTTKWVELCKNCIQLKKTALNSLFPKMVDWIHKTMNASDELGMWVNQNYGMYLIVHKLYSIKTNKCNYLSVTDDGWLNRRNNECDWWSMNMSALKLWNESNCTKKCIQSKQKTALTFLFPMMFDWIDKKMNVIDEVWMWVYWKYGMSQIVQTLYSVKTNICTHISVSDEGQLNEQNYGCEWWIWNVSALKLWNESNCTKYVSNKNKQLNLPLSSNNSWLN